LDLPCLILRGQIAIYKHEGKKEAKKGVKKVQKGSKSGFLRVLRTPDEGLEAKKRVLNPLNPISPEIFVFYYTI